MSLVAFLLICVAGLLLTLVTQPYVRLARLVALASLATALVQALVMTAGDSATLGEVPLVTTWFGNFFLCALAASSLLLCIVGLITGWPERLAPAALATMAAISVAVSSTDPIVALVAAAAATAPATLVASRVRATPLGVTVGIAELRTLGLVVVATLLAAVTIVDTNWNTDDTSFVLALAFLVLAAAVAVRSGTVPFHVPAALLSRSGEGLGLVLSLVWIPTGFGLVALSWNASIFGVGGDWLDRAVVAVQIVAVATLILGAVGAMLHDELEEIVVYSIVQDAGFILLALTAQTADAQGPARLWLLAFVIAKSALVAWAATASWTFESSSLGELCGWLRRSPVLGMALVAIVIATIGWPGSPVFEARATLVRLGLPDWAHFVGTAAILLSLAYYVRLLAVGMLTPTATVRRAAGDWLHWPRLRTADDDAAEPVPAEPAANAEGLTAAAAETAAVRKTPTHAAAPINEAELGGASARRRDDDGPHRPHHLAIRHRLAAAWRLNRPFQASVLVLATAALAAAVAFGGFGAADASQSGITLDEAAAQLANPSGGDAGGQPTPEPSTEPSAGPTLPFVPSPTPAASPAPTATPAASASAPQAASPIPSPTATTGN